MWLRPGIAVLLSIVSCFRIGIWLYGIESNGLVDPYLKGPAEGS